MSKPPADPDNKQPNDTDHMTHVYVLKLLSDTDARRIPWSKTVRSEAFMFTFYWLSIFQSFMIVDEN